MDKLYLGQENDGEVDALLAQLNDESILKLSVDTHVTTDGMRGSLPDDEDMNSTVEGIDPELAARYASLKAPRPRGREKGKASGKSKPGNAQPGDMSASSKRSSKGVYILEQPGNLARSNSTDSDSVDSLDAELIARLLALKSPSVPQQGSDGEAVSFCGGSANLDSDTPTLSEQMQALKNRSRKQPPTSPSRNDYPKSPLIVSSPSGWCAPTSPFKLMKALNMKKTGTDQSGPVSHSPTKPQPSQNKEAKKAVKKSLSHSLREDENIDPSATVADVQRLIAAVSKEHGQSASKETTLTGDKRTFNMKDRDIELLKAMEDEEAIALEAEKVLEWAKDTARLDGAAEESEDSDDLELSDSDDSDDSTGLKPTVTKKKTSHTDDSDPEKGSTKGKTRKGRRRWNFL